MIFRLNAKTFNTFRIHFDGVGNSFVRICCSSFNISTSWASVIFAHATQSVFLQELQLEIGKWEPNQLLCFEFPLQKENIFFPQRKMEQERWEVKVYLLFLAFFLEPFASSQVPLPSFHLLSGLVFIRRQGDSLQEMSSHMSLQSQAFLLHYYHWIICWMVTVWQPRWGISLSTRLYKKIYKKIK